MRALLTQLRLVARYERKMLLRSWAFRILSLLCIGVAFAPVALIMALSFIASAVHAASGVAILRSDASFCGVVVCHRIPHVRRRS